MRLKILAANLLWFLYSAVRARTWRQASRNVVQTQAKVLRRLLLENANTQFGRQHCFATIDSVAAFQKAVPIQTYEAVQPYIDEIASGVPNVLTAEPVQRFGVSSGSTQASKLVPYTAALVADFQAGIDPWLYYLMRSHPRLLGGRAYWSVTPIGDRPRHSSGGIPIGFDDERSYFGPLTQWVLKTVMATPPELSLVQDIKAFQYATLRFLLQEQSLFWMSVWNPTFVTLLLSPLEEWFDQLVADIRTGSMSVDLGVAPEVDVLIRRSLKRLPRRADELARARTRTGANLYQAIWPKLKLISCWAHGHSGPAVKQLQACFPGIAIQPKGLMATEAFVSFPLRGEASALSLNSHFFELEEVDTLAVCLAHQLEVGKRYGVVVTTSGGLYRYRLNDVIEVLGFEADCPLIRFVGKQDKVVDICGEKLNEQFVGNVVSQLISSLGLQPSFWLVAPQRTGTSEVAYTLFVQLEDSAIVTADAWQSLGSGIDSAFRQNYHYDYCRRLGQLGACKVFLIESSQPAAQAYLATCAELGQRLGDIKPTALHSFGQWSGKFQGKFIY